MTDAQSSPGNADALDFYNMSGPELLAYCGADAGKWAEAFCKIKEVQGWSANDIDEGLMIGWFANAIEHSSGIRTTVPAQRTPMRRALVKARAWMGGAGLMDAEDFRADLAEIDDLLGCRCLACDVDGPHASDCSVHNGTALAIGPCDCGASSLTSTMRATPEGDGK